MWGNMKIKIGFFSVCTLLAWVLTNPLYGVAALAAATLHELGHLFVARLLGISFREMSITPFGAALTPADSLGGYTDELLVAAAGPFINLFSVLAALPWIQGKGELLSFFVLASLFLGILNLLPVLGFDGGRMLSCFLSRYIPEATAEKVLCVTSFVTLFFLWSFSVYLLLRVGSSLSLFVFSCSLFCRLFVRPKT